MAKETTILDDNMSPISSDPALNKPLMSVGQIINMSFGFLGIQFGFALQNGNASRILQTFGADVEHLSWFWLVAPIMGMIVQPLIGYFSDNTWGSLGRRKPYFLAGAILAASALMLMPNAGSFASVIPALYVGAGFLMIMDASFNVAMEPFRALVADNLSPKQHTLGFSVQTCLIGIGAVVGSWLPWVLHNWFGVDNSEVGGKVGQNVILAFYIGAVIFLIAILWTVLTTREFPPDQYEKYHKKTDNKPQSHGISQIISDFGKIPKTMRQLGTVQFFSWFALFSMWVFTTPAVRTHVYGLIDEKINPSAWSDAGDWIGIIFGVYNLVSAIYALLLPSIANKFGLRRTHAISLILGGLGLISIYFIHDKSLLILPMIGVGIAWASILAMPYAMLAGSIPAGKMGVFMGIFNFFITLPQIVSGIFGGPIVKYLYNGHAIYALMMAGVFMIIAAYFSMRVDKKVEVGGN